MNDLFSLCPYIDKSKIYIAGFSNGGFMASDVALAIINRNFGEGALKFPGFHVAGICAYMGGIEEDQMEISSGLSEDNFPKLLDTKKNSLWIEKREGYTCYGPPRSGDEWQRPSTDVLVITGELDCQIFSTHNAWMVFSQLGCYTELDVMNDASHEYLSKSTLRIWEWFKACPHDLK